MSHMESMGTTLSSRNRKPIRKYDHSAFYPTIRASDVFLCSYPKSGTTWLGYLIAQAIKQSDDEALDLKSFNKYVPDVNLRYTKRGSLEEFAATGDPRFFLCHAGFDRHLPKVVYVVRDPRDVMVSYWHYKKFLSVDFTLSLEEFVASGDHWPCEWDEHVASWLDPWRHSSLMVVKYEDMHLDAPRILKNVLKLAGISISQQRLEQAVQASQFDQMRSAEEKFGVHGKAGDANERFVRKGRVGSWREEMSGETVRILEEKYGDVMQLAGYELASA